ncbi:MAG: CotH kinase family protein, partial [Clostridia bacterium]|nr:CotH kinase family protein [Clostridia bacterium]
NYVDTAITILGADVYGGSDLYAATGGIKLRGTSTMGYDKKPYRIKFDSKQNVFGLGKAKSWVLLANYLDPAAIRNDVAYSFGARLSAMTAETTGFQVYVPRTRPVEVYLNGEYQGLYDLGDHIQVDSTRIDIDESGDEFDDNGVQLFPEGNVGYYLEIEDGSRVIPEWHNEQAYYVTIENTGGTGTGTLYTGNLSSSGNAETAGTGTLDTLYVQIKTPEVPSEEQIAYIQDYLQTVNDLILAKDETVFDYIDMDGFIDWYLINEVFKNTDSGFLSSVKLFKDKDGKLFMGPVWDFDIGAGAVAYSSIHKPTGWRTRDTERCAWYKSLFEMDSFVAAVEKRWADLHENGILDGIFSDIDGLTAYLRASADDNYALWHDSYVNAVNNTSWLTVPDLQLSSNHWIEQVQYLRAYMTGRIAWLDEQFGYTETSSPAYVNMLSSTLTSTSSSKTFTINKSFPVQELSNLYLSVYSRSAFDITFNFDVGSPSLSSDWQGSDPLLPFKGTTGENIAAGTYTDVELNLENYMPWSNDPTATTVTLKSIVVKTSGNRRNVQISGLYAAKEIQADVSGTSKTPLGGKVFVAGAPEYEQTLRADTLGVTPYGADVSYQWYENGTAISGATSSTYTPASSQIGSAFTVAVTGSGDYEGTLLSEPVTLQKATYTYKTSQIPELISKTHNTLVILERENYEISVDGVNWQTSGTFEDLQPNTLYRVLYRHGETASQTGGTAGEALRVITDVDPNAPEEEEPDPTPVTPGDVNLDGYVNTSDVKRILKHALGTAVLTGDALTAADFDGDGQATTNDARALLKSLVSA